MGYINCPKCGSPAAEGVVGDLVPGLWKCGTYSSMFTTRGYVTSTECCLRAELDEEKNRHKSVCHSIQGKYHAWFCEIQLADCECNCGMQIQELRSLLNEVVSGGKVDTERINAALKGFN